MLYSLLLPTGISVLRRSRPALLLQPLALRSPSLSLPLLHPSSSKITPQQILLWSHPIFQQYRWPSSHSSSSRTAHPLTSRIPPPRRFFSFFKRARRAPSFSPVGRSDRHGIYERLTWFSVATLLRERRIDERDDVQLTSLAPVVLIFRRARKPLSSSRPSHGPRSLILVSLVGLHRK